MITNQCGIYKITNIITGDFYIGSANHLRRRINGHRCTLTNNTHRNPHLQNSWNKYGKQSFEFSVLLLCDIENKLYYEQVLLEGLKPIYNIATCAVASMQGLHHTKETRARFCEARKGRRISEETRAKISAALTGRHLSEEHVRKVIEANIGGHHISAEARAKLSKIHKGVPRTEETKLKMSLGHKGVHPSEEARVKMSEARYRYWEDQRQLRLEINTGIN